MMENECLHETKNSVLIVIYSTQTESNLIKSNQNFRTMKPNCQTRKTRRFTDATPSAPWGFYSQW